MMIENIDICTLVPEVLENMIKKIEQALEIVKNRKNTISNIAAYEKEYKNICPYCGRTCIIKNGHSENGLQNYKCKYCKRKFNDLTGTIFAGCHFTYEQLVIFLDCFRDKVSLRKTAKRMKVNKNSVLLLRYKIFDALREDRENMKLNGDIEADELYRCINLKGTKSEEMPRFSKPRTSANGSNDRGISHHKVCIISSIDDKDNFFLEIAGTGPVTSNMINEHLLPKIEKVRKMITDCKSSYESIAAKEKWNLKQVKVSGYKDIEGNNLANINALHSGISTFLSKFHGVSTKHLQGYLDWYCFDKKMNYKIEEANQNSYTLKTIIIRSSDILKKNMYDNNSGIDFAEVYSDYNYIPSPEM